MRFPSNQPVIVGSGLAALAAALAAAPRPVLLVTAHRLGEGAASGAAQGGIAAATSPDDGPDRHLADTLAVGDGLNDVDVAAHLIARGPAVIDALESWGVNFDRAANGDFALGREAGHSLPRIHHVADHTGAAIMAALTARLRAASHVTCLEETEATALVPYKGRIDGLWLAHGGESFFLACPAILLATGGAAGLFGTRSAPPSAAGRGLALAARAGAQLRDLEFVQFHPTALAADASPLPLLTEALRGAGALVIDERRNAFIDPLAPRDELARAIACHQEAGHRVFLDARPLGPKLAARFPRFCATASAFGLDPTRAPVPIRPAAHYHMGGIQTDAGGQTSITGLFAAGEAAASGLHGANRLASNSLLEAAAMGLLIGARWRESVFQSLQCPAPRTSPLPMPAGRAPVPLAVLMDEAMGIWRDGATLRTALASLAPAIGADDAALAAFLMMYAAHERRESRGAHSRSDFPEHAALARSQIFTLGEAAERTASILGAPILPTSRSL